jgi:hypothetical protein
LKPRITTWSLRLAEAALGVTAWVISYVLATIGLGKTAPNWLVPVIVAFGAAYIAVSAVALVDGYRAAQRNELRELEKDAYGLAAELRKLLADTHAGIEGRIGPHGGYTYDAADVAKAQERTARLVVENYEYRFAAQARYLAGEFRRTRIPQTDVLFRIVADGPKDDEDVFQIAGGLERLARQLREGVG